MTEGLYYAKGMEVWKSPVRTKIEGGESISLGFHACTASEVIGEEGATAIAALLSLGEEAQAAPPQTKMTAEHPLYRFLGEGDIIEATDEFIWKDCQSWWRPDEWVVGMEYPVTVFKAARRLVTGQSQNHVQCCMCGKKGLSTVEGDGGSECELNDGRWVCNFQCWDRAVEPTPKNQADAESSLKRQLGEMQAERDLLQDILDSRPAINAALPESYIRWSQAIYCGDAARAACTDGSKQ